MKKTIAKCLNCGTTHKTKHPEDAVDLRYKCLECHHGIHIDLTNNEVKLNENVHIDPPTGQIAYTKIINGAKSNE